ncbi:MAG: Gldg family protein [Planctomycetota bacterium]
MRRARTWTRVVAAALVLAVSLGSVVFAVRVVRHHHATRIELGRLRITELSDLTRARLGSLRDKLFLTYFVSGRSEMPSHMRDVERRVGDLLAAMQRAAGGRLDYQIVHPADDPDLEHYAAHRKAAPVRVRSVVRDGYSETTIWSAMTIAYGAHKPALLPSIGAEHLPYLQSLIVSHIEQMEHPRKPRYALAAPAHRVVGFEQLKGELAARGELITVDLDQGAPFPDDVDLLFWLEPQHVAPSRLRELDWFLATGSTAVIAGSEQRAELADADGKPTLTVQPTGYDAEALLQSIGLHPVRGLVLDKRCEELATAGGKLPAPYLIRCIGYDQDFRPMLELAERLLLFPVPTPLALDAERLSERGYSAHVLATTSDGSSLQPLPSGPVLVTDPQARGRPRGGEAAAHGVAAAERPVVRVARGEREREPVRRRVPEARVDGARAAGEDDAARHAHGGRSPGAGARGGGTAAPIPRLTPGARHGGGSPACSRCRRRLHDRRAATARRAAPQRRRAARDLSAAAARHRAAGRDRMRGDGAGGGAREPRQ